MYYQDIDNLIWIAPTDDASLPMNRRVCIRLTECRAVREALRARHKFVIDGTNFFDATDLFRKTAKAAGATFVKNEEGNEVWGIPENAQ